MQIGCLAFFFICCIDAIILFASSVGDVFTSWDAVVAWNGLARDWAAGRIPGATKLYPQLGTALWAITYEFIQDPKVQFFAYVLNAGLCSVNPRSRMDGIRPYEILLLALCKRNYLDLDEGILCFSF